VTFTRLIALSVALSLVSCASLSEHHRYRNIRKNVDAAEQAWALEIAAGKLSEAQQQILNDQAAQYRKALQAYFTAKANKASTRDRSQALKLLSDHASKLIDSLAVMIAED
jgi:hypothetical protein